jgi:serine/threonine protein kinase
MCHLEMAAGVEHIHSKNFVHRDINPTNILIDRPADAVQLKISDFYRCKVTDTDGTFLQPNEQLRETQIRETQIRETQIRETINYFTCTFLVYTKERV